MEEEKELKLDTDRMHNALAGFMKKEVDSMESEIQS